ncbi:hypothetical protein [Candidatus Regiella endosymbiont of Tuberolachnus salignus]
MKARARSQQCGSFKGEGYKQLPPKPACKILLEIYWTKSEETYNE